MSISSLSSDASDPGEPNPLPAYAASESVEGHPEEQDMHLDGQDADEPPAVPVEGHPEVPDMCLDADDEVQYQAEARVAALDATAPSSLPELFQWHEFNAATLMADPELKSTFMKNLGRESLIFELFESFSGLGTAGVTLKLQMKSMCKCAGRLSCWVLALAVLQHFACDSRHAWSAPMTL